MRIVFSDRRIWVSSGAHWIIAPFNITFFNPDHQAAKCKAYAMLISAYICRFNEWPEQLSPLFMLQVILDYHSFQEENRTSFLPLSVIAKYHARAAVKLITWHRILANNGAGLLTGEKPARTDAIYDVCIDATDGVDVSAYALPIPWSLSNVTYPASFSGFGKIYTRSWHEISSPAICNPMSCSVVRNT